MTTAAHDFHHYLGHVLAHAADDLKADAKLRGPRVNVRDPNAPKDIDVERHRLDVIVDRDFKITEISVG